MVELITPPKVEPRPEPPIEITAPKPKPKPRPIVKPRPEPPRPKPPEPTPIVSAPIEAPAPIVALAPPPEPPPPEAEPVAAAAPTPAPKPQPVPVAVAPPIFNADYLRNPSPDYPPLSRRLGEEGRVLLRVLVSPAGTADEVEIRSSSGHARLDEAARDTVRRWKFVPAKRGPQPVAAWVLIPISFRLEG